MRYVDPDGRILIILSGDENYINNVNIALEYLGKTSNGKKIIEALREDTKTYYIEQCFGISNDSFIDDTIYWDPKATFYANNGEYNSPAICLFHELTHAYFTTQEGKKVLDSFLKLLNFSQETSKEELQSFKEELVTKFEQKAANELGEPFGRNSYNDIIRNKSYPIEIIVDNPLACSKRVKKK